MCLERCVLCWVDFHSTWRILSLDIDDAVTIFEFTTAVQSHQLLSFFSLSPAPATPSVSSVASDNDRECESYGSNALGGFLRQFVAPLPSIDNGDEPLVECIEEL
jgi:hypothetical protein